jgi:hypothetical protein
MSENLGLDKDYLKKAFSEPSVGIMVAKYPRCNVFKSATSRPGAPRIPTGESDSTFRASRPTSWRLEFSSRLVVNMADQVGRLGALRSPASPRPIRNRNPKTEIPHLKMKYLS